MPSYTNPVMPGDFSDLDAIRVGDDYWAISSTMQYSPGMAVLHSTDLVNWRIVGHAVDDLRLLSPELNWDRMNAPGRGIWAGSIRFHAGKYWIVFGTPDDGLFMVTAAHPAGPWSPPQVLLAAKGWDDPCPFWDDDGQGYVVASHFSDGYKIHLFRIDDFTWDKVIYQARGSEANKLDKINGRYYHFFSEVRPEGRVVMMGRAEKLEGPWETRQINHVNAKVDREPNQGGIVQTPGGEWWFVTHQGRGEWEGRPGNLVPVRWEDGWPLIGEFAGGTAPVSSGLCASDDFDSAKLRPEWEWRYQPRGDKWSLGERRDRPNKRHLRLHAFGPLKPGEFGTVGNMLTQRSLKLVKSTVVAKLDLSGMEDGQEAGIAHFAKTYRTIGVLQSGVTRALTLNDSGRRMDGPTVRGNVVWLRSVWGADGLSQFSWSVDGRAFADFGEAYRLTWGSYRGDRVGLFTVNEVAERGYVDFDSFSYN